MNAPPYELAYQGLLHTASGASVHENKRTGQRVHWLQGGAMLLVDLSDGQLPVPTNRVYRPYVAAAEAAWILRGQKSIEWVDQHTSIWRKFATDGHIESAYGFRARAKWGDQIRRAIVSLNRDPSSRQVVINLWDAETDGMGLHPAPCPTQFVLNLDLSTKQLHGQLFMRSSDLFVGLPYDVMTWSLVLDAIAATLNCKPGLLTFFLAHPHLYAAHRALIVGRGRHEHMFKLPGWPVRQVVNESDAYVGLSRKRLIRQDPLVPYDPRPEVFE